MRDKDLLKSIIREQFFKLGQTLKSATAAKDEYRKQMGILKDQEKTYAPDYLAEQKKLARNDMAVKHQGDYENLTVALEKLKDALFEYGGQLDLSNVALTNALKVIEMGGKELSAETIRGLNAQFSDNQAALRMLQSVYKAQGVVYDGGLDKQIYDVESVVHRASDYAYVALQQDGSLNALAGAIGKIARMEGYEFDTLPDPAGLEAALSAAASSGGSLVMG